MLNSLIGWLSIALSFLGLSSCAEAAPGERSVPRAERETRASMDDAVSVECEFPSTAAIHADAGGVVLKVWSYPLEDIHSEPVLPADSALLAYRAAIREAGEDVRMPPLHVPTPLSNAEEAVWRDEQYNDDLVYRGEVGSIQPITCLDALLFAEQNARFSQLDRPTEFIASVLRRQRMNVVEVLVIFGAGDSEFPPRSVYGFDIVAEHVQRGWSYWYIIHNHTLQRPDERITLGVPAPSTSDVGFARNLAATRGLDSIRVTNGFYTFAAAVEDLAPLRQR
jgi:hypothetical protein